MDRSLTTIMAATLLGAGLAFSDYGGRYNYPRRRDFTIDEVEEQWVHQMMARARSRRRQEERRQARLEANRRAEEAAAIEATRPKSRQELRRIERKKAKRLREDRCFQKKERRL